MITLDNKVDMLAKLKDTNEIFRLGKLFNTKKNHYFYDTGTGKIIQLDDESYAILNFLFDKSNKMSWEEFKGDFSEERLKSLEELNQVIVEEKLFGAKVPKKFTSKKHHEGLEDEINGNLQQVILELTGRCNLRCRYCVYNESYEFTRNFHNGDMTKEIAKAAIDYTKDHSGDSIAVTFYGGEPLVKFDLLKWSIEYAKEVMKDKKNLRFSFTTNLTLVTEEIAEYLATVNNLSIVGSLDGPKDIQNSYRRFVGGKGTFDDAIRGLKLLVEAFKKNPTNKIAINSVFTPPYTFEKLDEINEFFDSLEWLPKGVDIKIGYANAGSVDDKEHLLELAKDKRYVKNGRLINTIWSWENRKFEEYSDFNEKDKDDVGVREVFKQLSFIHNRIILREPNDVYFFNGCCVPGSRRLYIDTKGDFYICERIGDSPSIGNVFKGIDFKSLKENYIDGYEKKSLEKCSKCWAIRLCGVCYCGAFQKDGFNLEVKERVCNSTRNGSEAALISYHEIYENTPEKLDSFNDVVYS